MAKSKTTQNTAETMDSALNTSNEVMKEGFDKAVKGFDRIVSFQKDSTDALIKSATVFGKGCETINSEVATYSRDRIENGVAAAKAIFGAKSVNEAMEMQAEYVRASIEAHVAQFSKLSEMFLQTTKQAAEPISARVTAFAELVQNEAA